MIPQATARPPALSSEPTSARYRTDRIRGQRRFTWFPPQTVTHNLTTMIEQIQAQNAKVILMQIRIPPNYGKRYSDAFYQIYPSLAEQFSIPLIPFFLEQVILKPEWMMADGLHPKPEAQPWIAKFVAEHLAAHL